MKPYTPSTNIGRTRGVDDIHHKTADQPRKEANKTAKAARHAARQDGKRAAAEAAGPATDANS
jgi:hypothetical protein